MEVSFIKRFHSESFKRNPKIALVQYSCKHTMTVYENKQTFWFHEWKKKGKKFFSSRLGDFSFKKKKNEFLKEMFFFIKS